MSALVAIQRDEAVREFDDRLVSPWRAEDEGPCGGDAQAAERHRWRIQVRKTIIDKKVLSGFNKHLTAKSGSFRSSGAHSSGSGAVRGSTIDELQQHLLSN